jgi:hypothetical protein
VRESNLRADLAKDLIGVGDRSEGRRINGKEQTIDN